MIYCGLPESPENGNMNFTGLHFGSEVKYWCLFGYSLDGADTATCDSDGNWTNPVPLCLAIGENKTCHIFPQAEAAPKITMLSVQEAVCCYSLLILYTDMYNETYKIFTGISTVFI